jgi:hypothetical protein
LLHDQDMRQIIFPHNDRDLTVALSVIGEQAHREAFRYDGWDGYSDAVTAFIRENGPEQSNRSEPAFLPLMHRSDVDSPVLLAGMVLSVAIDYGWRSGQGPLPECGTGGFRRCSLEREAQSTHRHGEPTLPLSPECLSGRGSNDHIESCCRLEIAAQRVTAQSRPLDWMKRIG